MASIKLILRTQQQDLSGLSPLYIRLIKDRKSKFITTGIKLKSNEWDEVKQKIKKNNSNSARLNAFLAQKIADASGLIADTERKTKTVSARKLKEAIKGKDLTNFFQYAYNHCDKIKGKLALGTHRNYLKFTEKFEKFVGHRDLYFEDITVTMLSDYVSYMSNTLRNGATTQHYSLLILSIMFKEAIREEIISANVYPFPSVKIKREKGKRSFLSQEQFEELKNLKINEANNKELYRDLFVFAVSAGGLRFADVFTLTWKDYDEKESKISKVIRKTKRQHSFKVGETAISILNKYKTKDSTPEQLIFPAIRKDEFFKMNPDAQQKTIETCNVSCNTYLRKIGKELQLPFSLSFHLSRHTFATLALSKGMRIEYVSKLLDHSDIGITQIYAKVISQELDKAVEQYVI